MKLTTKIRIFPTKKQEQLLWILSEKCRLIYNFALQERIKNWEENKDKSKEKRRYINFFIQYKNMRKIRNEIYLEYQWVLERILSMTLKKLDANYKSFFSLWKKGYKDARPPRYLGKKHFIVLCYNRSGWKIKDKIIKFSHKHPSKIDLSFRLNKNLIPNEKIKQIELYLDKYKKWYISICYEINEKEYQDNQLYQAIDLGISNIVSAVNLKGKFIQYKNKRSEKYWRKKIQQVQSKRDHCKKYSKKWRWYHKKICKMNRKMAFQLRDFQHNISKKLVENTKANTIIIGDLKIKQMAKKKKGTGIKRKTKSNRTLSYSLQNTGSIARFTEFLTYKVQKIGKRIIKIDESNTTKQCCLCGKKENRTLYERTINCICGNHIDRDLNSAVNIMKKFLKNKDKYDFLLQEPSLAEELFLQRFSTKYRPNIQLVHS